MEREILRAALAPDAECLSMEDLGRYADGALETDERASAASHVRGCLNCQAELALLHSLTSSPVRADEADIVRDGVARLERRTTRRWLPRPVAAAAAVLLVAAVGLYVRTATPPDLPRGVTTEGETTRSLAVTVRGPVGDQPAAPPRFEWQGVERAARYRVRILEVDGREIESLSTSALEVALPPSVRTSLAPGRTLLWDVTAYDASGAALAESGRQSFRLVLR